MRTLDLGREFDIVSVPDAIDDMTDAATSRVAPWNRHVFTARKRE
jgi:hypothetical protein